MVGRSHSLHLTYVALIKLRGIEPQLIKTTVSCCLFLFDFQHLIKYFENIFEKVCIIKKAVVYLYQQKR